MYKILVKAGARPAGSKITIDGIGEVTVGYWQNVSKRQAEMFSLMHPSGKRPTLIQAFKGNRDVEVKLDEDSDSKKSQDTKAADTKAPVVPSGDKGAADGSDKMEEKS